MADKSRSDVMVVDDDLRVHASVNLVLRNAGLESVSILPQKLEETLCTHSPGVVLLDLSMPTIDGIEALGILRSANFKGRVVVMSGGDGDLIETARRVGQSYGLKMGLGLQKPFRANELLAAVRSEEAAKPDAGVASEIARAFANREFRFYYQPKFDLRTRDLAGFESLVRWQHPTQGLLLPGAFLARITSAGFKSELARVVLKDAVARLDEWQSQGISTQLSINVALGDATDPAFFVELASAVGAMRARPSSLSIELLEATSDLDLCTAAASLARVRLLGVGISIDDFGTQSSSLARLQHLPANELKIDRSFVTGLLKFKQDQVIVRSVIGMARDLGLSTVAEGIEDQETLNMLLELGCVYGQGFHLAEPMTPERATELLQARCARSQAASAP